jgi:hypothetical protein
LPDTQITDPYYRSSTKEIEMVLDQLVESTYYPEASFQLLYVLPRIADYYSVHDAVVVDDDDDDETRTSSCGKEMRWNDVGVHQRI